MSSSFSVLLSTLPEPLRSSIQTALDACTAIPDEESLRAIVAGSTKVEITTILREAPLALDLYEASALAGLLAPTGNYISISHLINPLRFEIVSIISLISFLHRAVCFEITLYLSSHLSFSSAEQLKPVDVKNKVSYWAMALWGVVVFSVFVRCFVNYCSSQEVSDDFYFILFRASWQCDYGSH